MPPRRESLLRRLGPVGIIAIVAVLLFAFGLTVATVSVFHNGSPPATQPTAPQFTPVQSPDEPLPPGAEASSSASAKPSRSPSGKAAIVGDPGQEAAIVALVNIERARAGCERAVRMDRRLLSAARSHSMDMATENFLGHTGSDGSSPDQRMRQAGYDQPESENLAKGGRSAQDVMNAWMRSDEHRRNIINCDVRGIGVGLAIRNGSDAYWTQDFGR
jgi:uncharacterized protein YkwD